MLTSAAGYPASRCPVPLACPFKPGHSSKPHARRPAKCTAHATKHRSYVSFRNRLRGTSNATRNTGSNPGISRQVSLHCHGHGQDELSTTEQLDRNIWDIAIPALGSLALDPLLSVVDTAFVGRLPGIEPLGGLAVATALFNFSFLIFNFLSTVLPPAADQARHIAQSSRITSAAWMIQKQAPVPLIAGAMAEGDEPLARRTIAQGITLAVILGFSATAGLNTFAEPLLSLMGAHAGDPLFFEAESYLRVRSIAAPAVLLAAVGSGAFKGLLDTRTLLSAALGCNLANLVLDPVLIFGAGPIPAFGVGGAAAATALAEWGTAIVLLWQLRGKGMLVPLPGLPTWSEVAPLVQAGGALLVRTVSLQTVLLLGTATALAAPDGEVSAAAHQICIQIFFFLSFTVDSLAVAAEGLVADALGRGDIQLARRTGNRLIWFGVLGGTGLLVMLLGLQESLSHLFTDDAPVIAAVAAPYLYVAGLQPINGLVFVLDGILLGASDFAFIAQGMVVSSALASGAMLTLGSNGLEGVWQSLAVLQMSRGTFFGMRYYLSNDENPPLGREAPELPEDE
ncbi:hypothetical protein CYMTET_10851 [Cymbomonas tetramitiformis]|uniref:Protein DETOXIFICATION n=1 Tax=Cymbomonas tetramitiformis TaxID=36881 RepID=A0AAE0GNI2_9CHLO|nr:hypothetical protein CYMTET_10851 [Cymbomonas tetramitiformis]